MTTAPFLTNRPLVASELERDLATPADGAVVSFAGVVRDHHEGRTVVGIEYSAYAEMAEQVIAAIVLETEARWSVRVGLRHRVGALAIGDIAVVVTATAAHRDAAFAACRHLIDEVKARVPIWKHERYADGTTAWVDPTAPGGVSR